ncbi:MAG: asparagine synthase-related protein [Pseudonocardiaceae bacterium]
MGVLIEGWIVLPDRPDAQRVVTEWPSQSRWVLAHASGNLWLVGNLDQEVTLASVGSLRVALIGSCPVTATRLTDLVTRVRTMAELDAVARVLPGCFHLVASVDGVVRVQGSVTGVRRVFHTRIQRVPIAGDRADVLARMTGAGVDEQALAVRVASWWTVPPPLGERSLWRGVRALAHDHYLRIDSSGTVGERRWWQPPEPEMAVTVGAGAVRQALETAVAARRPPPGRLSADLSGGLDSTSLCFLAARAGTPDLLTLRCAESDDDAVFAAHPVSRLRHAEHVVLGPAEMPGIFANVGDTGDTEAPYPFTRTLARVRHSTALLAAHGARVHLAGHGGAELFHNSPVYQSRWRPVTTITQVRGYHALHRWPSGFTGSGPLRRRPPELRRGGPLRVPVWVTSTAVDTTRTVLHSSGDQAGSPVADRGHHVTLTILRMMGTHYRQRARLFRTAGLHLELPYFDDRVIEAVLAVGPYERRAPWRYKPLLVEAMRPILPQVIAARTAERGRHEDLRVGLRRNLPRILNVFADSALATRGLINPDLLRRALLAPQVDNAAVLALEDLLGCETWLRAAQTPSPHATAIRYPAPRS